MSFDLVLPLCIVIVLAAAWLLHEISKALDGPWRLAEREDYDITDALRFWKRGD